jgi:hypothetical protein
MRPDLQQAFREQAKHCHRLGSPFNGMLCELLAERLDGATRFGRRIEAWTGKPVPDALALRATGALHALARSGRAPGLTRRYPPHDSTPDSLWAAVAEALLEHEDFVSEYLERPPQTNEVARSSALLGAALLITERTGLDLSWHEIGASAGLNLMFDQFRYELGPAHYGDSDAAVVIRSEWQGTWPSLSARVRVAERAAADVEPLDPASAAHRERLLAYIWPDQSERLGRTAAALDMAAAAPGRVERASASDWVRARFAAPPREGQVRVLAHTIVWQYLSPHEQDAITDVMNEAGSRATPRARVAWVSMEADRVPDGAGVQLTSWPGGERSLIARADFHGRWVRWL